MLEQALVTLHGLLVSSMDILTCKSTHLVFLLMLLVLCPFFHSFHAAGDTKSQGQSITITKTIVSADAKFELGFFRPELHISIRGNWFKKDSQQTVTWEANRNHPIVNSSAVLTISKDGILVIADGQLSYSVSNMSSTGNATASATLLDSGNLVLRGKLKNLVAELRFSFQCLFTWNEDWVL